MRQIDFLIIGAAKSATTWLQQSLQANAGIFMPDPELHFFSRGYDTGMDDYLSHFAAAPEGVLCGEKSNSYLSTPEAAERIHAHFPQIRLVVQLRDPVKRAYSDYCMLYRRGEVRGDIRSHLDPNVAKDQRFIRDGLYTEQLRPFYAIFGAKQILVLLTEDIPIAPEQQLSRLADHIGLRNALVPPMSQKIKDSAAPVVPLRLRHILQPLRPLLDPLRDTAPLRTLRNAVARHVRYPPFPADLQQILREYYKQDTDNLESILGFKLTAWQDDHSQS